MVDQLHPLSRSDFKHMLFGYLPQIKSGHLSEAIAAGCGYGSQAAYLADLKTAPIGGAIRIPARLLDHKRMAERLGTLGGYGEPAALEQSISQAIAAIGQVTLPVGGQSPLISRLSAAGQFTPSINTKIQISDVTHILVEIEPQKHRDALTQWLDNQDIQSTMGDPGALSDEAREECILAMTRQLGPVWNYESEQPLHVWALLAIILSHGSGAPQALNIRQGIDTAYAAGDLAEVERVVGTPCADKNVQANFAALSRCHAYTSTILVALLKDARMRQGVLASAEMGWLRNVDRDLWYVINDTGRNAFHIESAGVFAHYFAEVVAGHAIFEPQLDRAIHGIEKTLFIRD